MSDQSKSRSVSQLLTLVVVIVVAIILAVSATGILMYWYEWSMTYVPIVKILPDSQMVVDTDAVTIELHLENSGRARAIISEISVAGKAIPLTYFRVYVERGSARKLQQSAIEVGPESRVWIKATLPPGYVEPPPGADVVDVTIMINYGSQRVEGSIRLVTSG